MQSAEILSDQFHTSTQNLLQALQQPQIYIELLITGLCVTLAVLITLLARRAAKNRVQQFLRSTPLLAKLHLPVTVILTPLKLLSPLLAILLLDMASDISMLALGDMRWLHAAVNFAYAWLLVRLVLLVVRTRAVALFISFIIIYLAVMHTIGLGHFMRDYLASMEVEVGNFHLSALGIVHGIVIFVVVFWLAGTITGGLEHYLRRSSRISYNARELILQFFRVIMYAVAFLITLDAMGVDLTALAVFGGALGVGVGLGLQKLTANFVSGVTILLEKSIKIGDLVEVSGNTGWVRALHTRYALLETFDGREVLVPNEELISSRVTNWTYSNLKARIEINVGVAYESDPKLAQKLMLEAAAAHPRCLKDPPPQCWLTEFADSALNFKLVFWVGDVKEGRSGPQSDIMFAILEKFKAAGVEIPYPRRVVVREGNEK